VLDVACVALSQLLAFSLLLPVEGLHCVGDRQIRIDDEAGTLRLRYGAEHLLMQVVQFVRALDRGPGRFPRLVG
jgi:hypothetical protein